MDRLQSQDVDKMVQEHLKTLTLPDYCYICDADLINPHNESSHYNSARHKRYLLEEKKILHKEYINISARNLAKSKSIQNKEVIMQQCDIPKNTESIQSSTDSILMKLPVKFMPNVIKCFEEQQNLQEYENLKNLLVNNASKCSTNQMQEEIRLKLILEMEKLIRNIYTPNHLPLEFMLKELNMLNNTLNSCKPSVDQSLLQDYITFTGPVSKCKETSYSIKSFLGISIIGVVIYVAYKCIK